jgi:hypothetical protein
MERVGFFCLLDPVCGLSRKDVAPTPTASPKPPMVIGHVPPSITQTLLTAPTSHSTTASFHRPRRRAAQSAATPRQDLSLTVPSSLRPLYPPHGPPHGWARSDLTHYNSSRRAVTFNTAQVLVRHNRKILRLVAHFLERLSLINSPSSVEG